MRAARSRRILAQRKFAQGAYVPPSAAPAPATNGDRRDNNPSGRNFIIQHQVGPSVFVDFISYQALEQHHKGLQPFVMVKRLEVPTSQRTRSRRTELMRNRELVRNKEYDKNRDIHDKNAGIAKSKEHLTNTQTTATRESSRNKETHKNKPIVKNKNSDKNNSVTAKDNNKNTVKNGEGANKEIVKNKAKVSERCSVKKKDISKNMSEDKNNGSSKKKETSNILTNKSNREKSQSVKKPKPPSKRLHVMSLRSKRQSNLEFDKKIVASRVTTRLSVAKRNVVKKIEEPAKTNKKTISSAPKSSQRCESVTTEFSLDDNRPLTYFAKCSTPKQPPVVPVPRVSLVPLSTATTATEPVAGPSGLNKKKETKTRTAKTKTNPFVLLPNMASPLPALTSTQTQPEANDNGPPFYSKSPNIFHWMNRSLDDEHDLLQERTSKPYTSVPIPCPALRWHTVKELNNAKKNELEARCLKCDACRRIEKITRLSETLQSQVNFDSSGHDDSTAGPYQQKDEVSSDGTIYIEMLPQMASSLLKIRAHNVLGKNMISACLIPKAHARQTKDLSLVEQEGLLEKMNATLTASVQAAEGRPVIETCSETNSATDELLPKRRPTSNMRQQRRQSVCAALAIPQLEQMNATLTASAQATEGRPVIETCSETNSSTDELLPKRRPTSNMRRQRRQSVCAALAIPQLEQMNATLTASAQATEGRPVIETCSETNSSTDELLPKRRPTSNMRRQRRQSVCAALAIPQLEQMNETLTASAQAAEGRPVIETCSETNSSSDELLPKRRPTSNMRRQRRQSVCAASAIPQLEQQRQDSYSPDIVKQARPQRERRLSVSAELATQQQRASDAQETEAKDLANDAAPVEFDITSIQISTPIAHIDMEKLDMHKASSSYEQNDAKPGEIDEIPNRIKNIFKMIQSKNESSYQDVSEPANRVFPQHGFDDESSGSGSTIKLHYDDTTDGTTEAQMMAEVDAQAKALENEKDAKGDYGPKKGHSSASNSNASNGFPSSAEGAQIVDAPVFHPSKEEFDDPISFFEKILPTARKYGICKVVPPEGWKPKCKINEDIRFDVTNQYISRLYCRWGPASRELSALKLCLQLQSANVIRPPLIDGVEVNLPKLYHIVQRHGGLENVINHNRWDKVAEEMKFNKAPCIERKLDQIYVKYLLPYATLDHHERQEIMKKVEVAWHHKNQKLLDRATNPLHRQKRMLGESESSDGETEDEATANALADAEDCIVAGQCMNFSKFKKVASIAYENHIGTGRPDGDTPSIDAIEDRYWRLVVMGTEHLCVNTAAIDTGEEGHGFTKNKNESYGRHPWNLKMFSQNPSNILRYLGPVLGMTVPTLHLGMVFSTSCWHKDPHALQWFEFMHKGPGRIWYGIPDEQSDNFRKAVETLAPTSCQNKSLWLPSDIAMIPPQILREHNVSLSRTVQYSGEFILVFPKAYSCSICTGYTESESVYFAPRSWLENLAQVIQETRESCEPTMFSLEQLLIRMCQDQSTEPEILKLVKPTLDTIVSDELSYRQLLYEKGLKFVNENETASTSKSSRKRSASAYNVRDQDECEYCRATLYFSKVSGLTGRKSSLCLEHALLLLDTNKYKEVNVAQLEVIVNMTEKELNDVVASVEARVGSSS